MSQQWYVLHPAVYRLSTGHDKPYLLHIPYIHAYKSYIFTTYPDISSVHWVIHPRIFHNIGTLQWVDDHSPIWVYNALFDAQAHTHSSLNVVYITVSDMYGPGQHPLPNPPRHGHGSVCRLYVGGSMSLCKI